LFFVFNKFQKFEPRNDLIHGLGGEQLLKTSHGQGKFLFIVPIPVQLVNKSENNTQRKKIFNKLKIEEPY